MLYISNEFTLFFNTIIPTKENEISTHATDKMNFIVVCFIDWHYLKTSTCVARRSKPPCFLVFGTPVFALVTVLLLKPIHNPWTHARAAFSTNRK